MSLANHVQFSDIQVGDEVPLLKLQPVNRTTLALYCGASGDHNPIHVDIDFARKSRMPDVFAHGMLSAAYLGRLLTQWVPQQQVRALSVRFTGITQLGHIPTCSGKVTEKFEENGEKRVRLAIRCANQYGEDKLLGEAVVALA
ncbi:MULTISPECIES: MaoC family dehydratase [Pseudomonas]|uniref:MaoC family dehydratase n=1 Tax=Pseudomonas sp. Hg7Tf TaxID=3236988 RepID=A0AB39I786_9PSED|nr:MULTISPECIES: MaoC family dehydratase [Pseudomonas]KJK07326.1 dehydratase [Pseudomonas sp. 5]MDD1977670.1 MaoC family dehydratase [Pseudomonas putida]MDH2561610.1 MaoC family dehydratase [Pseudomonas sp. Hg5Tf]QYX48683.1 MaoC family dehydratase [Pseudomonas sp. S11A 273]